jgi:VanZ family protein
VTPPIRLRRAAFFGYALLVVTATHWPALTIGSHGLNRLDLLIHAGVFALWTVLLATCGFFGPATSRRNIVRCLPIALVYATIDECSQGIPILRRTVDPLDLAANTSGIVLGVIGLVAWARLQSPAEDS